MLQQRPAPSLPAVGAAVGGRAPAAAAAAAAAANAPRRTRLLPLPLLGRGSTLTARALPPSASGDPGDSLNSSGPSSAGGGGGAAREFERDLAALQAPLRTRGKPQADVEGHLNKREMLKQAATWKEAVRMFDELGIDQGLSDSRAAGFVAAVFCRTVALLPGPVAAVKATLPARDAAALEASLDKMLAVILSGLDRVGGFALKDLLYGLVDSGLSRPRVVAALGVHATAQMRRMLAGEVRARMHACVLSLCLFVLKCSTLLQALLS